MALLPSLLRFPITIGALTAFLAVSLPAPWSLVVTVGIALSALLAGFLTHKFWRGFPLCFAAPALGVLFAMLWPGPQQPRRGAVEWDQAQRCRAVIASDVRYGSSGWPEFDVQIFSLESASASSPATGRFRLVVRGAQRAELPCSGTRILFDCDFDLEARRVLTDFRRIQTIENASDWEQARAAFRELWRQRLAGLGGRAGPLAEALTLGLSDDLTPLEARCFREAGASAVLALSGMHLGMLSSLLGLLFRKSWGRKLSDSLVLAALGAFVLLAGPLPSLVRSLALCIAMRASEWGRLQLHGLEVTALTAWFLLFLFPDWIRSLSFMLSLGAMAGIFSLQGLFEETFREWWGRGGSAPAALGCAATVGAGPFCLGFFGTYMPQGVLANLALAPPVMVFLYGSLGYLFLGIFDLGPLADSIVALPLRLLGEGIFLLLEPFRFLPPLKGQAGWAVWLAGLAPAAVLVYKYRTHGYLLRFTGSDSPVSPGPWFGRAETLGSKLSD